MIWKSNMISLMNLMEGKYDYGCVMARIDEESTRKILDFNTKMIGEHIIYREGDEYGREKEPHITLKYGLVNGYTEEEMRKMLHKVTPFHIDVKGISLFENEKFDVIKFDVDGKELRALNEIFCKLPNHDKYDEYHPHMTLAYVHKGMGKHMVKEARKIAKIPVNGIVYSNRGEKSVFDLKESTDEYKKDWLERHRATFDDKGRLIAYHGTTPNNAKSIKLNGFRTGSNFSLRKEYSRHWGIVVFKVHLPLDAIDFIMSDIKATRPIAFSEVV
jgi:2'-5' RNA ligase